MSARPGVGSTPHLAMEIFAQEAGFTYTHVPYTGVATAIVGLMGGHVDAVFGAPSSSISPQIKIGRIDRLGISAKERFKPHAKSRPSTSRDSRSRSCRRSASGAEGHAEDRSSTS